MICKQWIIITLSLMIATPTMADNNSIFTQPERLGDEEFHDYLLLAHEMKERRLATPDRFEASVAEIRDFVIDSEEQEYTHSRRLQEKERPTPSEALQKIISSVTDVTPTFRDQSVNPKVRIIEKLLPFWVLFFMKPCSAVPEFLDVIDALPLQELRSFCPGISSKTKRSCVLQDTLAEADVICGTITNAIDVLVSKLTRGPGGGGCPQACILWYNVFCTDCTDKKALGGLMENLGGVREGVVKSRSSGTPFGSRTRGGDDGLATDGSGPGSKVKGAVEKAKAGAQGVADKVKDKLPGGGKP